MTSPNDTHRSENKEILKYSIEQFDKSVVFIASGALGVSFAFIKDIIPGLQMAMDTWLLIFSWYLFAGVVFISLICHYRSMVGHKWAVDNSHLEDKPFNDMVNAKNRIIRILNLSMIIGLFLGSVLLITFIKINIHV